jgi:glutamine amidotransferase
MNTPDVAVIDYGMGNLLSVRRALEYCGATVTVTADPTAILAASRVVLPGVGAFSDGMAELRRTGLDDVMREVAVRGRPVLGICLGMQMMLEESEEFGSTRGLGLISGRVIAVPSRAVDGEALKIPHIGWNALMPSGASAGWQGTFLRETRPGEAVYFVHSFMAEPSEPRYRVADCIYGGRRISAVVGQGNLFGCQFHPEKSGPTGLTMLRTFLQL